MKKEVSVLEPIRTASENHPPCDIVESDECFRLIIDLPGISREEVRIEVDERWLTLTADRRAPMEPGAGTIERPHGKFERTFPLPAAVDTDRVEATLRNGVLEIAIPKCAKEARHLVPVKSECDSDYASSGDRGSSGSTAS